MNKNQPKKIQRYSVECSPLYRLSNKRELARLLGIELSKISSLEKSRLTSQYRIFRDRKSLRFITEPITELAVIHQRLLKFFSRIAPPEYVHSAIKQRSYKTNAEQHRAAENVLKIDIKKFFPSIKYHYVFDFFRSTLCCSQDIATILAKLCTVQTEKFGVHLPTGSCISPILSFLANQNMFDSIKKITDVHGCVLTVYVDDVTISGANATRELLTMVAKEIYAHGYRYHKIKTYHQVPAMVTGLIVSKGRVCLPNERARKIRELQEALSVANNKEMKHKLLASLVGRLSEAEQIQPTYRKRRLQVMSQYSAEWSSIANRRLLKAQLNKHCENRKQKDHPCPPSKTG